MKIKRKGNAPALVPLSACHQGSVIEWVGMFRLVLNNTVPDGINTARLEDGVVVQIDRDVQVRPVLGTFVEEG